MKARFGGLSFNNEMDHESEIKIDLGNELNYRRLIDFCATAGQTIKQDNYFFDTDDRALLNCHWAVRVRIEADTASLTLKGPKEKSPAGLAMRPELIAEISVAKAQSLLADGIAVAELPEKFQPFLSSEIAGKTLRSNISFVNYRITSPWTVNNLNLTLEIDRTVFSDGAIDYELEIELPEARLFQIVVEALPSFLSRLGIPLVFQPESKLARALKRNEAG